MCLRLSVAIKKLWSEFPVPVSARLPNQFLDLLDEILNGHEEAKMPAAALQYSMGLANDLENSLGLSGKVTKRNPHNGKNIQGSDGRTDGLTNKSLSKKRLIKRTKA